MTISGLHFALLSADGEYRTRRLVLEGWEKLG